ncbi:MAG: LysM peptidoglycan-binding domain-containing protein [Phycisphaerales bacterium]
MSSGPTKPVAVFALLLVVWIAAFWLWNPASSNSTDPKISRGNPTPAAAVTEPEPEPTPAYVPEPTPVVVAPPQQPATEKVKRLIPPKFRTVTIQKGDTSFAAVSRREFNGDARYAEAISKANPLVSPNKLIAGKTQLRIPLDPENIQGKVVEIEVATNQPAATTTNTPAPSASTADAQSYVVKSDDTLSTIAKRFYGKSGAWQKIFNANRDKIPSPERLKPGITITIPPAD